MPRHFMARAVVATAVLALGVLILLELAFSNDRQTPPSRPAVVSIEEALVQLRSQAARQSAAPAGAAALDAAKDDYGRSAQMLDAAWTSLAPAASDQLTRPQRVWIWRRNAACEPSLAGVADPTQREVQRLKCKADANRQRAAWLKQYSPRMPSEASAEPASPPSSLAPVMGPGRACAWLHARVWRLGQTLAFQGEYQNDHNGLAVVRPIGCDQGVVLSEMDPAPRMALDQADPPPWLSPPRRLVALFTARLVDAGVSAPPNDAIRLHVTEITNLRVVSGR